MRFPIFFRWCAIFLIAVAFLQSSPASAAPNLTPYQPSGWSDKIVVTRTSGSTTDSTGLLTTDSLYVDWSVINNGSTTASSPFVVSLYLDGVHNADWNVNSLPVNNYTYVIGQSIGSFSSGIHTVEIIADSTHVYSSSPNTYTKTITVGAVVLPATTLLAPANGAANQPQVPNFAWTPVSGASGYRILIATNAADLPSSTTASNGGPTVVINAVSPTTNFTPTITLTPGTTYHWEVHAVAGGSDDATWSSVQSFTVGAVPAGLTIVPTFDSTITSDPNAATIEATINAAISVYRWSFSDSATGNFTFAEMNGGLGYNSSYSQNETYSSYIAALTSHASTSDDATALAHLPGGPANPVNGNANVNLALPLARALGYSVGVPPGGIDSTIYLNTSIMNLSSFTTDSSKYSLFSTVSHEMDEALGFGSELNGLSNGAGAPPGPIEPMDLFRYDAAGNRSFTTSLSATSFFSLDGTTDLAEFNQFDGGDFGDFYSYNVTVVPQVQDAFLGPGVNPVMGVELRVLDVIGFHRVVPVSIAAQPVLTNEFVGGTNFVVTLLGTVGSNYILQATGGLSPTNWISLSTNTIPVGGSLAITNPLGTNNSRFFRARSQ